MAYTMAKAKPIQTKHWLALLGTLFVIVLIAHLTMITFVRGQIGTPKSAQPEVFVTRMIELPAIAPVLEKMPEVAPLPAQPRSPKFAKPLTRVATVPAPVTVQPSTDTTVLAEPPPPQITTTEPPTPPTSPIPTPPPTAESPPVPEPVASQAPAASSGDTNIPPPTFLALNTGLHTYKVTFTKNSVVNQGDAEILWNQDGERYVLNMLATYTLLIKTFNVFEQNSTGLVTPQGLRPLRFSDKRFNKSEVASHFDYSNEKITFSANKPEVPLLTGAQDRVSVIWQLAGLLAAQPTTYPLGSTFTVQTVSSSDAEPWLFTVNEPETLNLSTGPQIALRLTRNPRREFDQKIELWFATGMNYLPARFRFTETNGDYIDAVWQSVGPLPNVSN